MYSLLRWALTNHLHWISLNRVAITYRFAHRVEPYENAIRSVGLDPIRVNISEVANIQNEFEALLLPGGPDINPQRYGSDLDASAGKIDDERDAAEIVITECALRRGIPILGICRGMQLLNVLAGGTLKQHLFSDLSHLTKTTDADRPGKHRPAHPVSVLPETRLFAIIKRRSIEVNSRHHQAIQKLGNFFSVSALASDGIIEAIEARSDPFVLGVQWHPEDRILEAEHDKALFLAFATEIRRRNTAQTVTQ